MTTKENVNGDWWTEASEAIVSQLRAIECETVMATPRPDLIPILRHGQLDGDWWAEVDLDVQPGPHPYTYDAVKRLPKILEIDGRLYQQTGWNSDTGKAYYTTRGLQYGGVKKGR